MSFLFAGCKGTQKCITLTLEGPITEKAPYTGQELRAKVQYEIELDRPEYDWR